VLRVIELADHRAGRLITFPFMCRYRWSGATLLWRYIADLISIFSVPDSPAQSIYSDAQNCLFGWLV
jgi:hypothetical protein